MQLSVAHYQVLLCLDTYDVDPIALLCKLKLQGFYHVLGLSGLFL